MQNISLKAGAEALALGLVLLLTVSHFNQLADDSLLNNSLKNSSHALVFLLGTSLLIRLLELSKFGQKQAIGSRLALAFVSAFIVGIAIEILQPLVGRDASFLDILYNFFGSSAAVLLYLVRKAALRFASKTALFLAAVALMLISFSQPLYYLQVERNRSALFPVLFDFEQDWQREMFKAIRGAHLSIVKSPQQWQGNTSQVLRVDISQGEYPGVHLQYFETDWNRYSHLTFDLYMKSGPSRTIAVRIDDNEHNQHYEDRYNTRLSIHPGFNKIYIDLKEVQNAPKNRSMNLQQIEKLLLFAGSPETPFSIYLDNFKLLKNPQLSAP